MLKKDLGSAVALAVVPVIVVDTTGIQRNEPARRR